MRKILFCLFFGIMLIGALGLAGAETCEDSDGLNYSFAGKVKYGEILTVSDICLSVISDELLREDYNPIVQTLVDNMIASEVITNDMLDNSLILLEAYCPSPLPQEVADPFIFQKAFKCPNGCSDGACLPEGYVGGADGTGAGSSGSGGGNSAGDYYTCSDGSEVKYCEITKEEILSTCTDDSPPVCSPGSVSIKRVCNENPESLCPKDADSDDENSDDEEQRYGLEVSIQEDETSDIVCPQITNPSPDFCEVGEITPQYGEEGCMERYICAKQLMSGRNAEIKVMPETASQRAIERLGELNFTIELKETIRGDKCEEKEGCEINESGVIPIYEAKAKKQGRLFGLFKIRGEVTAEIDAETGEIISMKKPWWSFLASGI